MISLPHTARWVLVIAVAVFSALAVALQELAPASLTTLAAEDGPIELATAVLYLVAAVLCIRLLLQSDYGRLWWGLLALAFFLVAGEEVSWGQRVLGFGTPDGLVDDNVQGEFNLHNVDGLNQTNRMVGVVFFTGYFVVVPVALRYAEAAQHLVGGVRLPTPPLWIAPIIVIAILLMAVPRVLGSGIFNLDEVGEFDLALAAFMYSLAMASTRRPGGTA